MPTKRTPKYRQHKPTGQAVVTLNGKDHYLGKHNTKASREMYDRLVGEWLAHGRSTPTIVNDPYVVQIIRDYWRHAKRYYVKDGKPTSERACIKQAVVHLKRLYGRTRTSDFGPLALKSVRQAMVDAGMCRNVVNRHVARIKQLFRWAAENELIPVTTYQAIATVRALPKGRSAVRETDPVRPVPDAHVDAIEKHVSAQVWAMVQLQRLAPVNSTNS